MGCICEKEEDIDDTDTNKATQPSFIRSDKNNNKNQKALEFQDRIVYQNYFYEYPNYSDTKKVLNILLTNTEPKYWHIHQENLDTIDKQLKEQIEILDTRVKKYLSKTLFLAQKRFLLEIFDVTELLENKKYKKYHEPHLEYKIILNQPYEPVIEYKKGKTKLLITEGEKKQNSTILEFNEFIRLDVTKDFTGLDPSSNVESQEAYLASQGVSQIDSQQGVSDINSKFGVSELETQEQTQNDQEQEQKQQQQKNEQKDDKKQKPQGIFNPAKDGSDSFIQQQKSYQQKELVITLFAKKNKKDKQAEQIGEEITFSLNEFISQQPQQKEAVIFLGDSEIATKFKIKAQFIHNIQEFYNYWSAELSSRQEQLKKIKNYINDDNNSKEYPNVLGQENKPKSLSNNDLNSLISRGIPSLGSKSNSIQSKLSNRTREESAGSLYYDIGFEVK